MLGSRGYAQADRFDCGAEIPGMAWEAQLQKAIQSQTKKQDEQSSVNYIIPVIFHVVHGGEAVGVYPNILQGQILSQLTILNQDFSGKAYNASSYPANAFVNWSNSQKIPTENLDQFGRIKIADLNIAFCLATIDNNGNVLSEPGINRINYVQKGWQNPNQFPTQATMKGYLDSVIKPQSIWDVKKYLNVWITDKSPLLTYAGVSSVPPLSGLPDLPGNATDSTDGIWCYTKAIGSYALFPAGEYISQFIDGRTLTHEVGHYVGLRHIWGDAACGNDFCDDTPPAAAQNTGTPAYPWNAGSCASPSNQPDGEMFMNFMDYTRGPSKYMFTTDQKARAQAVMQNSPFRNKLGTHQLCTTTSEINRKDISEALIVYPNPTCNIVQIISSVEKVSSVKIYNNLGLLLLETDSLALSMDSMEAGVYLFIIETVGKKQCVRVTKQ